MSADGSQLDDQLPNPMLSDSPQAESEKDGTLVDGHVESQARNYTALQWWLVLAAIYSSEFLYGLDTTIVADIQGAILYDLGEVGKLGWLSIGFPLGSVAVMLIL